MYNYVVRRKIVKKEKNVKIKILCAENNEAKHFFFESP